MTTKKSSANQFGYTYKCGLKSGAMAPAVINFIAFLLITAIIPAITLFSTVKKYDAKGEIIGADIASKEYTYLFASPSDVFIVMMTVIAVIAAVAAAVFSFNFVTSKKTVNVFYSLGITREKLFLGKYLSGITLLSASVIIPMIISLIINISACGMSGELINAFLLLTISFTAIVITAFSITAAVFSSVGTVFETGVFSAILLFFPNIFFYGLQTLMDVFLYGSPYGQNFVLSNGFASNNVESLSSKFSVLSPVFFNKSTLISYAAMNKEKTANPTIVLGGGETISGNASLLWPIIWLVLGALIGLLGVLIFKKRKAEICGFIGTNKYLNTVGTFVLAFYFFCVTVNKVPLSVVFSVLIGVVVFSIVYAVLRLLLLRDLKKFVRGLFTLPAELAVVAVFVALFATGLFGFSSKMPDISEIKSAAITFSGVNDEFAFAASGMRYTTDGGANYAPGGLIIGGFESESDINKILSLHKDIVDEKQDADGKTVQIVYTLKNGDVFCRYYNEVSEETYKKLSELEKTDLYNSRLETVFKGEIAEITEEATSDQSGDKNILSSVQKAFRDESSIVSVSSTYLDNMATLNLTAAQHKELADCLYKDLLNRSVTQKYNPEKTPVAVMQFSLPETGLGVDDEVGIKVSDQNNDESIVYSGDLFSNNSFFNFSTWSVTPTVVITDDMVNVISFLKSIGVYEKLTTVPEFTSAEIVSKEAYQKEYAWQFDNENSRSDYFTGSYIKLNGSNSDNYGVSSVDLNGTAITDKSVIKELLSASYTFCRDNEEGGRYVAFYTGNNSAATICFVPESKLPDSVKALSNK